MKWSITLRDTLTKEEYTLGPVEAENYNEAVKIAKYCKGEDEEIANIVGHYGSIFEELLNDVQSGFLGRITG